MLYFKPHEYLTTTEHGCDWDYSFI